MTLLRSDHSQKTEVAWGLGAVRAELNRLAMRRLVGPLYDYEKRRWDHLIALESELLGLPAG